MTTAIFSIERDNEIVVAGGSWCESCLEGKPIEEQSANPKYCHFCYKLRQYEAELLLSNSEKPIRIPHPKLPETPPNQKLAVAKPRNPIRIPKQGKQPTGVHLRQKGHKKEKQGVLL